jgi:hypothetical protein
VPHSVQAHQHWDDIVCGEILFITTPEETHTTSPEIPIQLKAVMHEFHDIFQQPIELPPTRFRDHAIPLLADAKVINQRFYRLSHHQKDALEKLTLELQEILQTSNF